MIAPDCEVLLPTLEPEEVLLGAVILKKRDDPAILSGLVATSLLPFLSFGPGEEEVIGMEAKLLVLPKPALVEQWVCQDILK